MTALSALFARDARIAIRIGGGAMMGVLFFLAVVTLVPFAIGPDLALLRCGRGERDRLERRDRLRGERTGDAGRALS